MCGIVGTFGEGVERSLTAIELMNSLQHHRGPDHQAITESLLESGGVLGYSRLAFVGLGTPGNQPLRSQSRRFIAVFNGEIYNYRELAATYGIDDPASDGHVIIEIWDRMQEKCLPLLRGMFGLAVFDSVERTLTLSRDEYGIKPLYLYRVGSVISFASELRSLVRGVSAKQLTIRPGAIDTFLALGALPSDESPFEEVESLAPGVAYRLSLTEPHRAPIRSTFASPEPMNADRAPPRFADALTSSVEAHLIADVPVSVLLSAGVDSTMIALAAARLGRNLTCITMRSSLVPDEADIAAKTARHYGHEFVEVPVSISERDLDHFFGHMQRPSIDGLNTYLVSRAIKEAGFRVALSGLGGDEAMGGYSHARLLPYVAARKLAGPIGDLAGVAVSRMLARRGSSPKLVRLAGPQAPADAFELCLLQRRLFDDATILRLRPGSPGARLGHLEPPAVPGSASLQSWAQCERRLYLESTLLPDADAFSMAHSVELRVPFVDKELRRVALSYPARSERRTGKRRFVPEFDDERLELTVGRPKTGFTVPMAELLTEGPLRRRLEATTDASAQVWAHLDRDAALVHLGSDRIRRRWSEAWAIVALNSWLESTAS